MKHSGLLVFILLPFFTFSQNPTTGSISVFSEAGYTFHLYLDGIKQNDSAQSQVTITGLPSLYYSVRIAFKDSSISEIIKSRIFVSDGNDVLKASSYRIRGEKSGKPKLQFFSMEDIGKLPLNGPTVLELRKPEPEIPQISPKPPEITLITKPAIKPGVQPKDSIGIEKGRSAKATIKKDSSSKDAAISSQRNAGPGMRNEVIPKTKNTTADKCNGWPMGKADLMLAKTRITGAPKDETRLQIAREMFTSNCLSTTQIVEFCRLFSSEKGRLAFAKYAYAFTLDKKNYHELAKTFNNKSSKEELLRFLDGG